jgi:hypothetical protein
MTTITIPKKLKIGKESIVIFPLKKWREIEKTIEDLEDAIRFQRTISDPKIKNLFLLKK